MPSRFFARTLQVGSLFFGVPKIYDVIVAARGPSTGRKKASARA